MSNLLTRAHLDAAVRLAGSRRSDFDLNPEAKIELTRRGPLRPAAVLCGVVQRTEGLHVILTQRPMTMREHPGQVAFPGGKIDEGDDGPIAAALREAEEEIGLPHAAAEVLGRIDPYVTGTGFQVEPVVAMVDPTFDPTPDPREVADVFEAPLDFLMNPANLQRRHGDWGGRRRAYYAIPWSDRNIWGATAGMLKSLSDRIAALTEQA
ncbi:MAG: CoA pyrophosphatase [Pseudomonadota bacterium]